MLSDILQKIQNASLTFKYTNKGKFFMCTCPFHKNMEEKNPSCMINSGDSRFSIGFFHCLTCGESGGFKKLLYQINNYENILSTNEIEKICGNLNENTNINYYLENRNNILSTLQTNINYLIGEFYNSLPEIQEGVLINNTWREIPLNIVQMFKGKLKDANSIIFPVYSLNNHFIGAVTARIKPLTPEEKKQGLSNYTLSPGPWVSNALFNINAIDRLKNTDDNNSGNNNLTNLYIVEGPRDTMNLTKLGYCSLALLGCKNFGPDIPNELLFLKRKYNFSKIIIMMDGDQAGYEANNIIYEKILKSNNFKKEEVDVKWLPANIDPAMLTKID